MANTTETAKGMNIPFVDLKAQYQSIKAQVDKALLDAVAKGDFILGEQVSLFEKEWAAFSAVSMLVRCIRTVSPTVTSILSGVK